MKLDTAYWNQKYRARQTGWDIGYVSTPIKEYIEQTFFSSLPRYLRPDYARHMKHLLLPGGKLAGLLFNHEFGFDHPPFGGSPEEYLELFSEHFSISHFGIAYNSIKPRRDREHFVLLTRK